MNRSFSRRGGVLPLLGSAVTLSLIFASTAQSQGLPPVPFPPENPVTPEKALLGKILFWEEQLSSDGTVACGTCHAPARGGVDERHSIHPGRDRILGTDDDVRGAAGIIRATSNGTYVPDEIFGLRPQVTHRAVPTNIAAAYFTSLTWPGLAGNFFVDPQTGELKIPVGGALELQALGAPIIDTEMAFEGRNWDHVSAKIAEVTPLKLASDLPQDIQNVLNQYPTYPALFRYVYGDPTVNAERILYAIATYERTLIPDQSPWDRFIAGDQSALTPEQNAGLELFMGKADCARCHTPPLFSDDTFKSTGLRPPLEDVGRYEVTGAFDDIAKFKVPTLRNLGLRPRFMHTGEFTTLKEVVDFYDDGGGTHKFNKDPLLKPLGLTVREKQLLIDFLEHALDDPRVASATAPFDHPTLFSQQGVPIPFGHATRGTGGIAPRTLATVPFNVNNPNYKIGIADALGGSLAFFALSNARGPAGQVFSGVPVHLAIQGPFPIAFPIPLSGTGPGGGYATLHSPIPLDPALAGQTLASQWFVLDPNAPGGLAATEGVIDTSF